MNISDYYNEITVLFQKNANQRIVNKYSRFFKEGYDAYGVDPDIFEKWFRIRLQNYKSNLIPEQFVELSTMLIKSGKYEEGGYAIWLLKAIITHYSKKHFKLIKEWLDLYIKNWAHTDVLSLEVIFEFINKEIITLNDFDTWRISDSKWTRRAVPVTLIKLISIYKINDLLLFIHPMINDQEKTVQQGLGWFLREAWKKHPATIEKYLLKIKDNAPRTIIQYATEKMSKEEKLKFKKIKRLEQ
jgi:3-methyladenine DNA glycosylase AlkD